MKIGLHSADKTAFPNLALMKLSAWHKQQGHWVEWFMPLFRYDLVYSSKVFSWTPESKYLPDETVKGGSGYDLKKELSQEVEHMCPDYDLYGMDYSLGFLTRGCPRKCPWCIVPNKEGEIMPHADIEEFARHKSVVLMDNNVLAHDHGISQIEKIARLGLKVDFNQGLDARLIDEPIARRLASLKWLKPIRLACDHKSQMPEIERAVKLLRQAGATPKAYFCYVLVGDVDEAFERVSFLNQMGLDPFAQPYRDFKNTPPTNRQRKFARWVNHKAIFRTVEWAKIDPGEGGRT